MAVIRISTVRTLIYILVGISCLAVSDVFFMQPAVAKLQKAILLGCAILAVLAFGLRRVAWIPLFTFFVAAFASCIGLLATGKSVDVSGWVVSFVSLSTALLLFATRVPERDLAIQIGLLAWLPAICVALGFLGFAFGRAPWNFELSGAFRLRGALIPAHLSFLCVVAIYVGFYLLRQGAGRGQYLLLALNFIVLFLAGTRGGIVAAAIVAIPQVLYFLSKRMSIKSLAAYLLIGIFCLLLLPNVLIRNAEYGFEEGFNLSGRTLAWDFFMRIYAENPVFGLGLGAVTKLTQYETYGNLAYFVVPHNEYIRLLVDIGNVGVAILAIGALVFMAMMLRVVPKRQRVFFLSVAASVAVYAFVDNLMSTVQFAIPFAFFAQVFFIRERGNAVP